MNSILQTQNEPKQLDRLAAQHQLYADAKRLLALQMLGSVFIGVALALWVAHDVKHPQVRIIAGVWGLGFTLADVLWLTPAQKALKKKAATIQEMFDCDVLDLPWKRGREKVEAEVVAGAAQRHKERIGQAQFSKDFKDWYTGPLDSVPLTTARVVCQRANFQWDAALRRRYINAVVAILLLLSLGVFVYGIGQNPTMVDWLKVGLLPLAPLILLGFRQIWEHREAIETVTRLKRDAEKLWKEVLKGTDEQTLTEESRYLQDELLEQRSKNPLIFDWMYRRLKRRDEDTMNVGANALIAEALSVKKV
jgi:hypothetical protein